MGSARSTEMDRAAGEQWFCAMTQLLTAHESPCAGVDERQNTTWLHHASLGAHLQERQIDPTAGILMTDHDVI